MSKHRFANVFDLQAYVITKPGVTLIYCYRSCTTSTVFLIDPRDFIIGFSFHLSCNAVAAVN